MLVTGGDGGRGYPNVHLEIRDRKDRLVRAITVVDAADWERLAPDGTPGAELTSHVREVNRELGGFDLVATRALEVHGTKARGDGLDFVWGTATIDSTFAATTFAIRGAGVDTTVDAAAWRAPKQRAGGEPCDNRSFLHALYVATDLRVAIVDVAFHGTDLCWEPADQWHVVSY